MSPFVGFNVHKRIIKRAITQAPNSPTATGGIAFRWLAYIPRYLATNMEPMKVPTETPVVCCTRPDSAHCNTDTATMMAFM